MSRTPPFTTFVKPTFIAFALMLAFFGGGAKAEATNSTGQFYHNPAAAAATCVPYVAPLPPGYSIQYTCTGSQITGDYNCTESMCQNFAPENYMWQSQGADATFGAFTDKSTYAPGETVQFNSGGWAGDQGNNVGGWLSGGLLGGINNSIWCFILGCSTPPPLFVLSTLQPYPDGSPVFFDTRAGSTVSPPQTFFREVVNGGLSSNYTFTAPIVPGNYTISVRGCITNEDPTQCVTAYLGFTVSDPRVDVHFSTPGQPYCPLPTGPAINTKYDTATHACEAPLAANLTSPGTTVQLGNVQTGQVNIGVPFNLPGGTAKTYCRLAQGAAAVTNYQVCSSPISYSFTGDANIGDYFFSVEANKPGTGEHFFSGAYHVTVNSKATLK